MADAQACAERVARFRALMAERGIDAAIIRNNPDLRWLTGAERTFDHETAHTAVITQDAQWLHTDSRYYNTFQERLGADTPWQIDQDMVEHAWWAAQRVREARARVVAVEDTCSLAFFDEFNAECLKAGVAVLTPRLHGDICDLRMVKDEEEVANMRQAQSITDAAFEHMCGFIKVGMTEMQIRAELENYMLSNGADALAFDSIIAAGPNGANPHAQPGASVVREGDFIVMDYGAGYHDYKSDMTRTVCVGTPSAEQRKVYDIVRATHEACAEAIHAGVIGREIHELSVRLITEAGYGDFYKHGLGHGVGIEIHENPNFGRTWNRPVPAGSIMTVEPGIYLPGKFGVRLEDYGIVTETGYEPFTKSPHELVCIPC